MKEQNGAWWQYHHSVYLQSIPQHKCMHDTRTAHVVTLPGTLYFLRQLHCDTYTNVKCYPNIYLVLLLSPPLTHLVFTIV